MSKQRVDFYSVIHKAIRQQTCDLLIQAGKTDFNANEEVDLLEKSIDSWIFMMEDHAALEDKFFRPLYEDNVEILSETDREHEWLEEKITRLKNSLQHAKKDSAKGHAVYLEMSLLVAFNFEHLYHEESKIMPYLHARYTDDELSQVNQNMLKDFSPSAFEDPFRLMLPTMNNAERVQMFSGMKNGAPPPVYKKYLELASEVLSSSDFQCLSDLDK